MNYTCNFSMEFLEIDDGHLAVYDNESGDTHYIEGTGKVILELLKEAMTEEALIQRLCDMYEGDEAEIAGDIREFLAQFAEKKLVVCA